MVNNLYEIWPYQMRISIAQEAQILQIIFHSIAQCKHKSSFYNVNTHPFDSLLTSTINCNLWQCNIQNAGIIQNIFFKSILIRTITTYNVITMMFLLTIKSNDFFTVVDRGKVICVRFLSSILHQFIVRINPLR